MGEGEGMRQPSLPSEGTKYPSLPSEGNKYPSIPAEGQLKVLTSLLKYMGLCTKADLGWGITGVKLGDWGIPEPAAGVKGGGCLDNVDRDEVNKDCLFT